MIAVIAHYYEVRRPYLKRIVEALNAGTVKPEKIVIWNNEPRSIKVPGAVVINSGENLGCAIRHLIALAFPSDRYLFHDNDLLVKPDTVEKMMASTADVVGIEWFARGIILGRLHLCTRKAVERMEEFRRQTGTTLNSRCDDIIISAINRTEVVSVEWENLPELKTGYSLDRGHYEERKAMVAEMNHRMANGLNL